MAAWRGGSLDGRLLLELHDPGVDGAMAMDLSIPFMPLLPRTIGTGDADWFDGKTGLFRDRKVSRMRPRGLSLDGAWYAGDQHLHSALSLDAAVLSGTEESAADYADVARTLDLDWIIITDHSNIHAWWFGTDYYTESQFNSGKSMAAEYRETTGWNLFYSEEMGLGRTGFWELPSHILAYPLLNEDAPFLENPSSGLVFGHASCEDEQVILDRINDNGYLGFIAHPFSEGSLTYAQWNWNNGATGWAGFELWSGESGEFDGLAQSAVAKWHELLNDLTAPTEGDMPERPGFPTRFPVGVGNSDAHEIGFIGVTFTWALLDGGTSYESIANGFLNGSFVASNGPLVTCSVNTATIGEVGILPGGNAVLDLSLMTTEEFSSAGEYELTVIVNGEARYVFAPDGVESDQRHVQIRPFPLEPGDHWVSVVAAGPSGYRALTNPVFLQPSIAGDCNGDGTVNTNDLLALISFWGECIGCPEDGNGDGLVNVQDLIQLIANWG